MAKDAEGSVLTRRLLELTWKPGKIILQTELLIVAYFVLLIASWIAPSSPGAAWFAAVIIFLGRVIAYFVVLLGMTAVAKMTLAELKGKDPVSAREAFSAAMGKIKDVVASPIKIFALLAGLAVFHVVIDLFGKIPFVGELAWMFSPVFTFPLGIAMVAAILVLVFGAMILPTIIILGKEGPVSELIDFLRRHTVKFAGHFLVALVVAVITLIVLVWAIGLSNAVSDRIMGEKLVFVQNRVPQWLQQTPGQTLTHIVTVLRWGPMYRMTQDPKALRWTIYVAGFVYGLIMWLIHMSFWGFVAVNFSVAGTLSYTGLTGDGGEEEKAEPAPEKPDAPVKEEKKPAPPEKPKKAAPKKAPAAKKEEKPAAEKEKPKE
ncbi:MAG: hypothetical protein P9M08_05000 [Candidatus Erginobacter occultus]|nr:hypothetical protein [Candidatus Erginobacter occultus]